MNNEKFYLKYPLFQILFGVLWCPIGFVLCLILAAILARVVTFGSMLIIRYFWVDAFSLYVMSGRMDILMFEYQMIIALIYTLISLIAGVEIIYYYLKKNKNSKEYGDMLKDVKDQILFKKSDNNI